MLDTPMLFLGRVAREGRPSLDAAIMLIVGALVTSRLNRPVGQVFLGL